MEALWGDAASRSSEATVQTYVSQLRRLFGSDGPPLVHRAGGYVLDLNPNALDASRFEAAVAAASAVERGHQRPALLDEALGRRRGGRHWTSSPDRLGPMRVHRADVRPCPRRDPNKESVTRSPHPRLTIRRRSLRSGARVADNCRTATLAVTLAVSKPRYSVSRQSPPGARDRGRIALRGRSSGSGGDRDAVGRPRRRFGG